MFMLLHFIGARLDVVCAKTESLVIGLQASNHTLCFLVMDDVQRHQAVPRQRGGGWLMSQLGCLFHGLRIVGVV